MDSSSNTIFEKNKALFAARYPNMFELLDQARQDPACLEDLHSFQFMDGKKGLPTFSITDNTGRTVYGHSLFDPIKEAEMKFRPVLKEKSERIVLFGFGFGYHIQYLLENLPENVIIIVIEPFPTVVAQAMQRVDLTPIFETGRIRLTFSTTPSELMFILGQGISTVNVPRMYFAAMPYLRDFMPDSIQAIKESITGFHQNLLFNLHTIRYSSDMVWKNMIQNFYTAARNPGMTHFVDAFKDKPVFIVAPGPSLDLNKHQLKRVKGKALIVAVDTATRILLKDGIEPDVIVTIDYQQRNYNKLKGVDTSFAYMFPAIEVYYEIPNAHKGRVVSYYHSPATMGLYDPIIGSRGSVASGGSVLTDAFSIVHTLGADPIIFMGVDLGFPGERWYADGSFDNGFFTASLREGRVNKVQVPDIFGNPMTTYVSFRAFLQFLSNAIPRLGRTVIDATEGGAAIRGAKARLASDVIDEYVGDGYDPRAILSQTYDSFTPLPASDILERFDAMLHEFKDLQKLARRGLRHSKKAITHIKKTEINTGPFLDTVKKIQRTRSELGAKKSELEFLTMMLDRCMSRIFYHDSEALDDPATPLKKRKEIYREILELDRDMFKEINDHVEHLFEHFEEVKTKFREEEGQNENLNQG